MSWGVVVNIFLRTLPAVIAVCRVQAQSSPQELANTISQRWTANSTAEFAAVYPFREAQQLHANIAKAKLQRVNGLASVIRADRMKAALLLSGVPLTGNSGDDTSYGMGFSAIYEAVAEGERWKLDRQIPLDEIGQILSQRIDLLLRPGHGVDIEDRLRVRVKSTNGFAARLNHHADVRSVRAGGREVRHQFGGGLLWVDLPEGEAEVTLAYSLEVERAPADTNSGCFTEDFGHIRNQYSWHPWFGFDSAGDHSEFQVVARIPKEYSLTTSLPQTERVEGAERIVDAKSVQPSFALTLAYDREWRVSKERAGDLRLELFVTPAFRPGTAAIVEEFRQVHSILANRFGEPDSGYVAVVQLRADQGNYWHFNSNQAVFAAGSPGFVSVKERDPAAKLGHEIGHFWTNGSGPAANFLREGWATYVESLVLEQEFGHDTAALFWKQHARAYFDHYDGRMSIWNSGNETDLNYDKGSWIFRMLEAAVGTEKFQKAMTEFSKRSLAGSADWETLADCLERQKAPDFDARQFLLPWLKEKRAPRLTAQADGRTVTIVQAGPAFILPVTVEGTTSKGTERHIVWIRDSQTKVQFTEVVSGVRIDPDGLLLLAR